MSFRHQVTRSSRTGTFRAVALFIPVGAPNEPVAAIDRRACATLSALHKPDAVTSAASWLVYELPQAHPNGCPGPGGRCRSCVTRVVVNREGNDGQHLEWTRGLIRGDLLRYFADPQVPGYQPVREVTEWILDAMVSADDDAYTPTYGLEKLSEGFYEFQRGLVSRYIHGHRSDRRSLRGPRKWPETDI